MHHDLIPADLFAQLVSNGLWSRLNDGFDPPPAVKLHLPGTPSVWLLRNAVPGALDLVFGVADHGTGRPTIGHYRLTELRDAHGYLVACDPSFRTDRPFTVIVYEAAKAGRLIER
ncbi:DUF2958 domain-containing protein [Marinivivus vitaminiproducens]|uniref:DUF2958 domain-containing protein n=1 Tax=Marinivivus vitaminiproducens TaxID=3035935 RepID=UPI00279F9298|nr:DUF2958 domain-containing protein [Geminicoccaceae bacterium SCSIO 64248]